jgi:hypothetical protein
VGYRRSDSSYPGAGTRTDPAHSDRPADCPPDASSRFREWMITPSPSGRRGSVTDRVASTGTRSHSRYRPESGRRTHSSRRSHPPWLKDHPGRWHRLWRRLGRHRTGQGLSARPGRGLRHRPRIDRERPAQRQGTSRPRPGHLPPHRHRDVAGRRQLRPDLVPRMRARLLAAGRGTRQEGPAHEPHCRAERGQVGRRQDQHPPDRAHWRKARPQDRVWPCDLNSPCRPRPDSPTGGRVFAWAGKGRGPFLGCQRDYGCCVGVLTDALLGAAQDCSHQVPPQVQEQEVL